MKAFFILLTMMYGLSLSLARAGETFVLNSSFESPFTSPQKDGVLDVMYQTLAKRMGVNIQIQYLPAERALLNANSGIDDGDVCRVPGIEQQYPELKAATEPFIRLKLNVFSSVPDLKVTGFESLHPYRVGILIGRKKLENSVVDVRSLIKFATDEEIVAALSSNQIDVGIFEKSQGVRLTRTHKNIKLLEPEIYKGSCYLYLNKKHSKWLPLFSEEIKKMKKDGSMRKIWNESMRPYLNGEVY